MDIKKGCIVKAMAGRDINKFFLTIKDDERTCYIVDGKLRKLDSPKKKNKKHLAPTLKIVNIDDYKTDKSIRELLHDLNYPKKN